MLAYAISRGLNKVYLLYPQYKSEDNEPNPAIMNTPVNIHGESSNIDIYAVRIPFVFEDDDDKTKRRLKESILSLL